ncbi:ethionine resistance protein, partial [Tieghemiomyces parasiticus]
MATLWQKLVGLVRRDDQSIALPTSPGAVAPAPPACPTPDEATPFLASPPRLAKHLPHTGGIPSYDSTATLINSPSSSSFDSESLYEHHQSLFTWTEGLAEAKILIRLTCPVVFTYLLQSSINMASVFSLGHLGAEELAASALATMLASVTGWAVGIGLVTALDTLCSQSFTGSQDVHAVGTYLQRGIIIITACHVPIVAIWWHSEALLLLLNQDPVVARLAGLYLQYLAIGCLPNLLFECVKRFLQAQ